MPDLKKNSSRAFARMAIFLVAMVSCLLLGGSWLVYNHSEKLFEERRQTSMVMLTEGVSLAVLESLLVRDFAAIEARLIQALSNGTVKSAVVTDVRGNVIANVARDAKTGRPTAIFSEQRMIPPASGGPTSQVDAEGDLLTWHLLNSANPVGWLRLEVIDDTKQALRSLARETLTVAVIFSGFMLLVFGWVLRRAYLVIDGNEVRLQTENSNLTDKANNDPLTGLPNRTALMNKLQDSMARIDEAGTGSLGVCFIDLDRFKPVNDEHGHRVGDKVLQSVTSRIRTMARQGDYLARIGGDEFVLIVHGLENTWEIEPVLSRLLHVTTTPFLAEGHSARLGFSIGVTIYPHDKSDANTLINHADQAMYKAKRTGGGGWAMWQPDAA
jgi:diguanylate cyclase (GGDEF)-like protein